MKNFHVGRIFICILLAHSASAQIATIPLNQHPVEKPALFTQLPEKFTCSSTTLQTLFLATENSKLTADINNQFHIEGTVLEKVMVSFRQLSINIRCTNFQNALLNVSRITQTDGSFKYTGRMVSPNHGDVLLLSEEKGQYTFIKQKQLLSMVE